MRKRIEKIKQLIYSKMNEEIKGLNHSYLLNNNILGKKLNFKYDVIYKDSFKNAFVNNFKWNNLPMQFVDKDFIEKKLLDSKLAFTKVGKDYYFGSFNGTKLDINMEYVRGDFIHFNGKTITNLKVGEDVFILKNNSFDLPTSLIIDSFVNQINLTFENMEDTLQTSIVRWLLEVNEDKARNIKATINNMFREKRRVAVVGNDLGSVNQSPLYEEFTVKEKWEHINNLKNELFSMLGIQNNPNFDKKERLVVNETTINKMQVDLFLKSFVDSRLDFILKVNKRYGLNIELLVLAEMLEEEEEKEKVESEEKENEELVL